MEWTGQEWNGQEWNRNGMDRNGNKWKGMDGMNGTGMDKNGQKFQRSPLIQSNFFGLETRLIHTQRTENKHMCLIIVVVSRRKKLRVERMIPSSSTPPSYTK
jgi:hypothetical protein